MIDSLLFLPDVDGIAADASPAFDPFAVEAEVPTAPDDAVDAQVAAAVEVARDGQAHAARGAWEAASAALERSAALRDTLVASGVAGPIVAARAWSDVATVRVAAGDLDGAHAAFARVRASTSDVGILPPDVSAALAELDAALGSRDAAASATAGGLLWLDTTDDAVQVAPEPEPEPAPKAAPPSRITAIDDVVALADSGAQPDARSGGLGSRLRRLLRR